MAKQTKVHSAHDTQTDTGYTPNFRGYRAVSIFYSVDGLFYLFTLTAQLELGVSHQFGILLGASVFACRRGRLAPGRLAMAIFLQAFLSWTLALHSVSVRSESSGRTAPTSLQWKCSRKNEINSMHLNS